MVQAAPASAPASALAGVLSEFGVTEVYFGDEGFHIHTPGELPDAQLGYSRHPDGTDLTGDKTGDWRREWVVIGRDASLGDPYFVDAGVEGFPVYTAMHGTGAWEPCRVSPSLRNFLSSLSWLRSQSRQDDWLLDPDDSTITDRQALQALEQKLSGLNGEPDFWGGVFERYRDWLEEAGR